jgi:hypothetical protein
VGLTTLLLSIPFEVPLHKKPLQQSEQASRASSNHVYGHHVNLLNIEDKSILLTDQSDTVLRELHSVNINSNDCVDVSSIGVSVQNNFRQNRTTLPIVCDNLFDRNINDLNVILPIASPIALPIASPNVQLSNSNEVLLLNSISCGRSTLTTIVNNVDNIVQLDAACSVACPELVTVTDIACSRIDRSAVLTSGLEPPTVTAPLTLCSESWQNHLHGDPDEEYIMNGVLYGFRLVDVDVCPPTVYCRNYQSATVASRDQSETQINLEIKLGRYVKTSKKPHMISSLGAIPKTNNRVRLIHDLTATRWFECLCHRHCCLFSYY